MKRELCMLNLVKKKQKNYHLENCNMFSIFADWGILAINYKVDLD